LPEYYRKEHSKIEWLRPQDICAEPVLIPEGKVDCKQGALGDCWLLGAMLSLSPKNLQNLVLFDGLEYGFVIF
jgi:hypothetical protein